MNKTQLLYQTFEQHLFSFQNPDADRNQFILEVIQAYLGRIRKLGLTIPAEWEHSIMEELFVQVNEMLLKKIYGCQNIDEYLKQQHVKERASNRRINKKSA